MQRSSDRQFASVQELLPLEDVVDGVLCLRGGDYRAVLEAQSVNFALKSDAEQEAIMAGYRAFLNALSYPVQVVVRILPTDVEPYLTALRGQASTRSAEPLRRLAPRPRGVRPSAGAGEDAPGAPLLRGHPRRAGGRLRAARHPLALAGEIGEQPAGP